MFCHRHRRQSLFLEATVPIRVSVVTAVVIVVLEVMLKDEKTRVSHRIQARTNNVNERKRGKERREPNSRLPRHPHLGNS